MRDRDTLREEFAKAREGGKVNNEPTVRDTWIEGRAVILRNMEPQGLLDEALAAGLHVRPDMRTSTLVDMVAKAQWKQWEKQLEAAAVAELRGDQERAHKEQLLDENWHPTPRMRGEMRRLLVEQFGEAALDALDVGELGNADARKYASDHPAADVAGVPFERDRDKGDDLLWDEAAEDLRAEPHWHDKILLNVDPREMRTQSADHIVNHILPQALWHFLRKNAEYGDQHREEGLGPRGEFVGIQRKVRKLRRAIWDGDQMQFEGPEEMLYDLIGSALLTLDLLAQE